jgi:predicted peroxiredoxin
LYVATCGTNDPTKAIFPFNLAIGAKIAEINIEIVLPGGAAYLAKADVVKTVHGVGFLPLSELLPQVIEAGIPIHV